MIEGYAYCQTIFEQDKLIDLSYTEVNAAFGKLTGLHDVVGRKISDILPGFAKTNPEFFESLGRVALTGEPEKFETYIEPLNIWLSLTAYSSGRESFVAVFDNITESKRAESAIRESEVRYRLMFEANPYPMWVYDLDTLHFLAVNDAAVVHYGYSREEFMTMTLKDIRPLDQVPKLLRSAGFPNPINSADNLWLSKKDGSVLVLRSRHTNLFLQEGR